MTIYSHIDADDGQHPYPHPHNHHRHGRCAVSPFGIGPRGKDGEKGEKGDTFTFDDLTDAQLAELREGVSTVYYRKTQETYYTSGTLTSSIEVPIAFSDRDMLFVDVEGLDLVEGRDYTVSGDTISLDVPITHSGTRVNFTVLTAVAVDADDLDGFWGDLADATRSNRGLMTADDKLKLDKITPDADAVKLTEVATNPPHGKISVLEATGTASTMKVPVLDNGNRIKKSNLPEGFQSTDWTYFIQNSNDFGRWRAANGIVFIEVHIERDAALTANSPRVLGSVSSEYRPDRDILAAASTDDLGVQATIMVSQAGAIVAKAAGAAGKFHASISYPIN